MLWITHAEMNEIGNVGFVYNDDSAIPLREFVLLTIYLWFTFNNIKKYQ